MALIPFTPDETIKLLSDKAKASGDKFAVKVHRRRGMGGLPEHIATLSDATLNQLASPETWLPVLCGGGEYTLAVSHMDEDAVRIGGMLQFKFSGEPHEVWGRVVSGPAWQGPGSLVFPSGEGSQGLTAGFQAGPGGFPAGPGFPVQPNPYFPAPPPPGAVLPPGYSGPMPGSAPPQFGAGQVFGAPQQQAGGPSGPTAWERERDEVARTARERADAALREREFELREKEREAKLRAEFATQQATLEAKIASTAQGAVGLKDTMAALAPVVIAFLQTQAEARREAQKLADEAARRQEAMLARQQELQMAQQAAAQAQLNALMLKLTETKGPDPSVTMMMEMMKANNSGSADMMMRIVEAMGTVSKTSVSMIEAISEIQLGGQPEHPILGAIREGVKAMAALSQGATQGGKAMVKANTQTPQLPAQVPPAPAQASGRLPNGGAVPHQVPAPQVIAQAPGAPGPNMPQAFDGLPGQGQAQNGPEQPVEGHVIERLKELIMARTEPVEQVAAFFVACYRTNEFNEVMKKYDNDVNGLITDELGLWAMSDDANRAYLGRLGPAVEKASQAAGILEDDDGEEELEEGEA